LQYNSFIMDSSNFENKKLTGKEERFCQEYVMWLNATKAAVNAGYSEKSARMAGSRLMTNDNIKKRIEHLKNNLAETSAISALRISKEHEKIAFMDAGQIRDGWMTLKDFESLTESRKACIQEITTKQVTKNGDNGEVVVEEWVKLKLYDKQKSLDSLSRMLGYDAPKKLDIDTDKVINITFDL